jgi:Domain of unknown function (DUF4440)
MNKLIASLFLFCLLGCSSLFAQTADEKAVADRMETLRKTLITPDKKVLEELAADELSYGHSTGVVEDKVAFIDALVKGKVVLTSITLSDQTIKIAGDIAIMRHRMTADLNNNNVPTKVDVIVLLIWRKQKGVWKLLARQAAKIPV